MRKSHSPVYLLFCLLLLLSLAPFLLSCPDDDDDDDQLSSEIWPLAVGNTWTHTLTYQGNEMGTALWTVSKTETVNGVEVYQVDFVFQSSVALQGVCPDALSSIKNSGRERNPLTRRFAVDEYALWKNHADGLYEYGLSSGSNLEIYETPKLVIKYPVSAGETFEDGWSDSWSVISTSTTVDVPAGSFDCHHYQNTYNAAMNKYVKPDTGYIKSSDTENNLESVLTSYSLP
ncbi:hypothetical protein ACFL27_00710 [candidate division CSSED10-310 bacterium]|uniref:Lipoprotein n=1 Tax=candidate division CSSED10-310 bacterium TaxID=2855610 RepID=A0ABV6YRI1_UNCC1